MNARHRFIALSLLVSAPLAISSWAQAASFETLITTPLAIEGLTNDNQGNLYTPARGGSPSCPVYRVNIANPSLVVVGNIPAPCSPSGLAFNRAGRLFVSQGSDIVSFVPNSSSPPAATVFASGVPGTNGLAFDRAGNLWTGDGTTGLGRVWKVSPAGLVTEMFRVQPMVNVVPAFTVGATTFTGVGRDVRTVPTGNSQPLVANGLAFDREGNLFIADTARGAIWKVSFEPSGQLRSQTGCDTTFTPNTLCLENIFVQHSLLDGADGIALDEAGNIWVSANERNAMVVVSNEGREVTEVFRNPPDPTSKLRNGGPLETPTSPALSDLRLCTANSDGGRRDNSPPSGGELPALGLGKISCMTERLQVRGMPLPVR
ncbi:MAG TPA: SMP-30/gluconolactonase/LRE family protein [Xanthobacteraceae bacterium]|nr:SMP-30/gluconolactonase/LRE family protein [Xanthobacteraceae bacterium]